MNIALIGYGKTGKEIERLAPEHHINVIKIFNRQNNAGAAGLTAHELNDVDVCIDFSVPHAVVQNITAAALCGKNIVIGTTGWYGAMDNITAIVKESNIGLLYAANFSIGMNVFYHGIGVLSELCDKFRLYDVAVTETHHNQKLDSPSATALAIAQHVMEHFKSKKSLLTDAPEGKIQPEQLHVSSLRLGSVIGNHRVIFDSDADCIEMVHTAKNRSGFAHGALIAARWLNGKQGVFTMNDVITSIL